MSISIPYLRSLRVTEATVLAPTASSSRRVIGLAISVRLLIDTSVQIFNPFLAVIAAGLGIDLVAMGRLVSLRSAMGLATPIFGAVADRIGYRPVMRLSLLAAALGLLVVGLSHAWTVAALGMALMGLGLSTFIPTLQAYLSTRLPYERRAQGMAVIEYAWALAGIVGLFLAGLLIEATSWRAPFFVLASGLLFGAIGFGAAPVSATQPRAILRQTAVRWRPTMATVRSLVDLGRGASSAWGAIAVQALIAYAISHVLIIHGGWLTREYSLGPAQLGSVALAGGLADLGATVLVGVVADRIGKRRSVLLGTAGALVAYSLLPLLNRGVILAVIGICLARFCFEFSLVSNIPLLTEQIPKQRAKVLALASACGLVGITLASLSGPWAYTRWGVWGLGPAAAIASALALAIVLVHVRERGATDPS